MMTEEEKMWCMVEEYHKMLLKEANMAKYGCEECSNCGHQFDFWTTRHKNGGRKKRAVIKHPHEREIEFNEAGKRLRFPVYLILPCGSCPEQFKDMFWARHQKAEEAAFALQNGF